MLKIYLQIFAPIAICLIVFLNYNVFIQKPMEEDIEKIQRELRSIQEQRKVLDSVLEFQQFFQPLQELQFQDFEAVRVFLSDDYNEPRFMHRIQRMVDLSGATNTGIIVGRVTQAARRAQYNDFKTDPSVGDELGRSVESFLQTMGSFFKDPERQKQIMGEDSSYASRLLFYQPMSTGKAFPRSMARGIEMRRFNVTVQGNYNQCKRLLWLISENRPYTQAVIMSFNPITPDARGPDKKFELRLVIITYADRNGRMQRTETPEVQT